MPMLLLDEMYAGLKEHFEALGWKVLTVQEAGLQSAKDRDIVEHAGKHDPQTSPNSKP